LNSHNIACLKQRLTYIAAHAAFYDRHGVYFTPSVRAVEAARAPLARFQQIGNVPFLDAVCRNNLLLQSSFAAVATSYVGPSFNVINAGFFLKPAHDGAEVPWHQDAATWGIPPGAWSFADAPRIFDYWLALDDADDENGALELLPGSQHLGPVEHSRRGGLLPQADPDRFGLETQRRVAIRAAAGDLVVYHHDMFHRSSANRSPRPRLAAAGTLIAPDQIQHIKSFLPKLSTLERCPIQRDGQPAYGGPELPARVSWLAGLRARLSAR
jgi:ectoine hydroxylase-related dioxygenase (phytanoyl-CoA dioxygenase family)